LWANTIRRAAVQDPDRLRRIAEKLLSMAEAGDPQALREMGDRIDGKAMQTLEANVTGNLAGLLGSIGRQEDDSPVAG